MPNFVKGKGERMSAKLTAKNITPQVENFTPI